MTFPFGQPVTLVLRTKRKDANGNDVKDDFGDVIYDVSEHDTLAAFDPGGSGETEQAASVNPTVYLPPDGGLPAGVKLDWVAQVRVDGTTYEVDGQPGGWKTDDWDAGVVVRLKAAVREPR